MKPANGVMGIVNNLLLALIAVLMGITGHFASSIYDEFRQQREEIKDLQLNERVNDVKLNTQLQSHERRLDEHDEEILELRTNERP